MPENKQYYDLVLVKVMILINSSTRFLTLALVINAHNNKNNNEHMITATNRAKETYNNASSTLSESNSVPVYDY